MNEERPSERPSQPFLSTSRALGACTREFARLSEYIADMVVLSFGEAVKGRLAVRRSPERCIIQVGPSALTVGWIQDSRDSVADGELLVILWRGTVAPSQRHKPERAEGASPSPASALWEVVFTAEATCEADWMWRSREVVAERYSSSHLAGLIVDRLRIAHETATRVA